MLDKKKTKIIVVGLNRSGTKLASYLIAKALKLRYICLEPFSWRGGVDTTLGVDWKPQLAERYVSKSGPKEHARLPVFCSGSEVSKWMNKLLRKTKWDLVKFVEIGRAPLCRAICPDACIIGIIREPVSLFTSLSGSTIQKDTVTEQWTRLKKETECEDPLPDANEHLPEDLADSARLYIVLHKLVKQKMPDNFVTVSYENLVNDQTYLKEIGIQMGINVELPVTAPMLGVSTKQSLTPDQEKYLRENLTETYTEFLL